MKIIRNISMQGLTIPFGTPEGIKQLFLVPRQQVEVPDSWMSPVSENLAHRRLVKIKHRPDPAVVVPTPAKKYKKSK